MKLRLITYSLLSILSLSLFAQTNNDEQLAGQYYQNKEYDKALVYYEKLYQQKNPSLYYDYYISCLIETKDFKKAEKVIKKEIKQNLKKLSLLVDLGQVYKASGDEKKSQEQFVNAIKTMDADIEQVNELSKAFTDIKQWDYAIDTYRKAQRIMRGGYSFNFELAEVYGQKGDIQAMVNEYLDVLEISDSYIQAVQNALQVNFSYYADEKKTEVLKNELIKRVQQSSDKPIFNELLIWLLLQQKEYDAAFMQVKALDKRNKEDGSRVMNLARVCVEAGNYDMAIKAYDYVVLKGKENYNYVYARIESLNTSFKKITQRGNYTNEDLVMLEQNYLSTLNEIGWTETSVPLIKNLAHIQAFYLDKKQDAADILSRILELPGITAQQKAECKLTLGDVLLMQSYIWEASLLYSQVEKEYKHDAIGQEAKFRNARLSYFNGDFKWAQAQLDVLKAATAKLIANDAMDLSLKISDNIGLDSNTVPMLMFASAELLAFQNKDAAAIATMDSIVNAFPNHELMDDILFTKAKMAVKRNKPEEAAAFFQKIMDNYSFNILGDDALFNLADLYENRLNNKEKAKELYQEVLTKYPGSLYTVEARKRFRILRGDVVN